MQEIKKNMKKAARTIGMLLLFVAPVAFSEEEEPNAPAQILDRAFLNLYDSNYIQELEIIVDSPGLRPVSKELQIIRKQNVRPGKALIRFQEPYDIRRTAVLILENQAAADDFYVYIPAMRMTRRISSAQRADAFFGTDLSFEDIEPKTAKDYLVRSAGYKVRKSDCVSLEAFPANNGSSTYKKMALCVNPNTNLIHGIDFYRSEDLSKQLDVDISSVQLIAGKRIAFLMTMRSVKTGSTTKIVTKSYQVVRDLPESIFTARNLEAGDAATDRARITIEK